MANQSQLASITPYLCVSDAPRMIEFYKTVFGAVELGRIKMPDGRIGHAELKIGNGMIMLAEEFPEMGFLSPKSVGPARSPVLIHSYVEDCDAVYRRGIDNGARLIREPADQEHGDRVAQFSDPSGHVWFLATRKRDVSLEELQHKIDSGAVVE
jgi:PhnB protein